MTRNPYDAHLCAQGPQAAADFQAGFNAAAPWVQWLAHPTAARAIWRAVRDSDGGLDWAALGWPHDQPWLEGFALGVYGEIGRTRHHARTRTGKERPR